MKLEDLKTPGIGTFGEGLGGTIADRIDVLSRLAGNRAATSPWPQPTTRTTCSTHDVRGQDAQHVWSWDITCMPSPVRGKHYYLYLIENIYSRKAVGWGFMRKKAAKKPPHSCSAA